MINFVRPRRWDAFSDDLQEPLQKALDALEAALSVLDRAVSVSSKIVKDQVGATIMALHELRAVLETASHLGDLQMVLTGLQSLLDQSDRQLFGDFIVHSERLSVLTHLDEAALSIESACTLLFGQQ